MKAYLEGGTLPREERSKSRLRKENQKIKESASTHTAKIKLSSEAASSDVGSVELKRKNHQRMQTQVGDRNNITKYDSNNLNKTHSKSRLKTEMIASNHQTIKLTSDKSQKSTEIQNYSLLGLVKERLMNDTKTRRQPSEHPVLKKLMDLTQKAKEIKSKPSKNPEEGRRKSSIKELHRSMGIQVKTLKQQIVKQGKQTRQLGLCEVLNEMVTYSKQISTTTEHCQSRLLARVKELQQRNLRLISLMNRLKSQGVDVDSFWLNNT